MKETVTNFGSMDVLPNGVSLNFNKETGEFRAQGEYTRPGSKIKIKVDQIICTVDKEEGACN